MEGEIGEEVKMGEKGGLRCMAYSLYKVIHKENRVLQMVFVGHCHRQAEMEEITEEMFLFSLMRVCWDVISRNGRKVREAASVCLLAPN